VAGQFEGVRLIRQPNRGIGAARKRLVEEAKSDWIAFCDHDDWWEPNKLERQIPFCADSTVSLVYTGVWHEEENGARIPAPLHANSGSESIDHVVPHPEDIWTSSTLLRREAVLAAGNFNPSYRSGEDMLMWFQLGAIGKIVQVPDRLVHMLRLPVSTSSADRKQFEFSVSLYEIEVLPRLDKWYAHVDQAKRDRCRKLLQAKLGYAMSILATYYDQEGDRAGARRLYRRAVKLAPRSKGAWYRFGRSLLGAPVQPPTTGAR